MVCDCIIRYSGSCWNLPAAAHRLELNSKSLRHWFVAHVWNGSSAVAARTSQSYRQWYEMNSHQHLYVN